MPRASSMKKLPLTFSIEYVSLHTRRISLMLHDMIKRKNRNKNHLLLAFSTPLFKHVMIAYIVCLDKNGSWIWETNDKIMCIREISLSLKLSRSIRFDWPAGAGII